MELKVKVIAIAPKIIASISAEGLDAPVNVTFNPRKDSNGTAFIATLPQSLRQLGTATNLTVKAEVLTLDAEFVRVSVAGSKPTGASGGRRKDNAPRKPDIRAGLNADGSAFEVFSVSPTGDRLVLVSTSDAHVLKAAHIASGFDAYVKALSEYAANDLAVFNSQAPTARAALKALGVDDAVIDATIAATTPTAPTYTMPK